MTVRVAPGAVYARVRAFSDRLASGWATWNGNSTVKPPASPDPQLPGAYKGGLATITWSAVNGATAYNVGVVSSNGDTVYTKKQTATSFSLTPEIQTGGPYRNLSVLVSAAGAGGTSKATYLTLSDAAPKKPTAAEVQTSGAGVTLKSVTPSATDGTGYMIAMGATSTFQVSQASEFRQTTTLPYTWSNLTAGKHYFRVAVKDQFYDLGSEAPAALNWSDVLTVEIA